MSSGKLVHMNRIFDKTGTCIIFAGCHQMTSKDIYPGQFDVVQSCQRAMEGGYLYQYWKRDDTKSSSGIKA